MFVLRWTISIILTLIPVHGLICPIYNIYNNQTSRIQSCQESFSKCQYVLVRSSFRRCLGIYQLDKHQVFIRQLAVLDDIDNRYANQTQCMLEVDKTGQNLLCRCNTDNCTLYWRTPNQLSNAIIDTKSLLIPTIVQETEDNRWFLPLTMSISLCFLAVIVIVFILIVHRYRKPVDFKPQTSSVTVEDWSNNSIISQGKNSIIYQVSNIEKNSIIKLYNHSQASLVFENESTVLGMIEHESIIKMLGHGLNGPSPYIILEYHPLGSLKNYLAIEKISWDTCYSFIGSILQAVDYLHCEILSPDGYFTSNRVQKPIIIHRDIKSTNIVVKSTTPPTLCLIDFGLGKILPPILTSMDFVQIGTYRYMAPELLELAISYTSEALCKVDMYALGLVMWEIVSQCEKYPEPVAYQLPYAEYLKSEETNDNRILDILHRVVVNERKRPILHRTPIISSNMNQLFSIIEDCWKHEPEFRIGARPALSRLRRLQ